MLNKAEETGFYIRLKQDHDAIDAIYANFAKRQKGLEPRHIKQIRDLVANMYMARDWQANELQGHAAHYFNDGYLPAKKRGFWAWLFNRPQQNNVYTLFKDYISKGEFKNGLALKENGADVIRVGTVLQSSVHKIPDMPSSSRLSRNIYVARDMDVINAYTSKSQYSTTMLAPAEYKTAKASSSIVSLATSFMTPLLLSSVSRYAVIAGIGSTVGFVPAAVAAGIVAGAATSYYKNRHLIAQEVALADSFGGRMKARAVGFYKSYSMTQLAMNAGFSFVGAAYGGVIVEQIAKYVPVPDLVRDATLAFADKASQFGAWALDNTVQAAHAAMGYMPEVDTSSMKAGMAPAWEGLNNLWNDVTLADSPSPQSVDGTTVAGVEADVKAAVETAVVPQADDMAQTRSVLAMVEHKELPAADAQNVFDSGRFDGTPVMRGGVADPIVGKSALANALTNDGTPAERAAEAFAAVTNPKIPVSTAVGFETVSLSEGDTIRAVIETQYGIKYETPEYRQAFNAVIKASGLENTDFTVLDEGTELKLPLNALVSDNAIPGYVDPRVSVVTSNDAAQTAVASLDPAPVTPNVEMRTVQRGDSLWKLTRTQYGLTNSADRWAAIEKIVAANADKYPELLKDPTALTRGWELAMPDLADPEAASADCKVVRGRARGCTLG